MEKEIFDRVVHMAMKGGWKFPKEWEGVFTNDETVLKYWKSILLTKEFAQSFWDYDCMGLVEYTDNEVDSHTHYRIKPWEFHLQQMVIHPEPFKYLEDQITINQ